MHDFDDLKPEYTALWSSMTIRPERKSDTLAMARKIASLRARYDTVSKATGVPWYVVGIIHAMECGLNFSQHLHNGNSLERPTVDVPAGRPNKTGAPFEWTASAIDALTMPGKEFNKITDWSIERIAYCLELYNGFGYRAKNIPSPYLWSFTTAYVSGKYVRDHVFSASAVSDQCGGMALLKALIEVEPSIDLMPVAPVRTWPAAAPPPAPALVGNPIKAAFQSNTVRAIIGSLMLMVTNWLSELADLVNSLIGNADAIKSDFDSSMSTVSSILVTLKMDSSRILLTTMVALLIVAAIRHVEDKQKLGGN